MSCDKICEISGKFADIIQRHAILSGLAGDMKPEDHEDVYLNTAGRLRWLKAV